jgi:hypothetical protein
MTALMKNISGWTPAFPIFAFFVHFVDEVRQNRLYFEAMTTFGLVVLLLEEPEVPRAAGGRVRAGCGQVHGLVQGNRLCRLSVITSGYQISFSVRNADPCYFFLANDGCVLGCIDLMTQTKKKLIKFSELFLK